MAWRLLLLLLNLSILVVLWISWRKLSRAVMIDKQKPFICFSASGGARMQEGLTSFISNV